MLDPDRQAVDSVKCQYSQISKANEQIEFEDKMLAYIVSLLQMLSLLDSGVDVKDKACEEMVGSNLRGDRGKFFTPCNSCSMMANMPDLSDVDLILETLRAECVQIGKIYAPAA